MIFAQLIDVATVTIVEVEVLAQLCARCFIRIAAIAALLVGCQKIDGMGCFRAVGPGRTVSQLRDHQVRSAAMAECSDNRDWVPIRVLLPARKLRLLCHSR